MVIKDIAIGDEVWNRFDEWHRPFVILKIEDQNARPNRIWVLTVDQSTGEIIFDNTVWLEKSGRQFEISEDLLEALEKILASENPVYTLPKELLTFQNLHLVL